ncbi:MAG TPA: T9SS type A sorting domain-containing protein [Bacteroidales bacterium]|nr:T9SS type A sorting domain-containing protein [Bacteroidales bacterium]HRZ49872.1 T9SS type A sorting domain-containing protein [Bacteroidales bacterium]
MKLKTLLSAFAVMVACMGLQAQNDTLIGFDFSDSTNAGFTANYGLPGNLSYDVRAEDSLGTTRPLSYTNGAANFAATATGWDGGADNKFWSVKFKADGYTNIRVSGKLSSGGNKPGPKNWKIQARKSGGAWVDITGGTITIANDWTTGVVTDLALPASFDLPGTTSLYIRWIMTSNESVTGPAVLADGICKIDDILITGTSSVGIEDNLFSFSTKVYPNPASDFIMIESPVSAGVAVLMDSRGAEAAAVSIGGNQVRMDLGSLEPGIYVLVIRAENESQVLYKKVVVL